MISAILASQNNSIEISSRQIPIISIIEKDQKSRSQVEGIPGFVSNKAHYTGRNLKECLLKRKEAYDWKFEGKE